MTNFEKYKEKLFGILAYYVAVDKETEVPFLCNWVDKNVYCSGCERCIFNGNCSPKMATDWLNAEYIEPPINNYNAEHDAEIINKFAEELKSRLGDAIYPKDFVSMKNLIDDVVKEQKNE